LAAVWLLSTPGNSSLDFDEPDAGQQRAKKNHRDRNEALPKTALSES
jgi:hypothetical protein